MSKDMNKIDFDSYVPYYIQLMEALRATIKQDNLQPGAQLPSEPDLCEKFGVSRTVVRQALRELELQGLISRRKGKGTFVAQPKISESLVQRLTGFFHDMIERGHVPETRVLEIKTIPAPSKAAQFLEIEPGTPIYAIERLRSIDGEPSNLVSTFIPEHLAPGLDQYDLETASLYATLEKEYGLTLARGRRAVEAVVANRREAELLTISPGDPMILLDSVTFLEDGTPIEYYHAVHRGDRSRFEVELVRVPEESTLAEVIVSENLDLPPSN